MCLHALGVGGQRGSGRGAECTRHRLHEIGGCGSRAALSARAANEEAGTIRSQDLLLRL